MAKILSITPETVCIGLDGGQIKEVPAGSLNFVPHVGDEVEIFESIDKIIVSKVEKRSTEPAPQQTPAINIVNTNTNANVNTNKNTNINAGRGAGKPKNKWVAFVLCLFLGFFGAHKFYEGNTSKGILYLFTMGLFGIGWIGDMIAILAKPNPYYV